MAGHPGLWPVFPVCYFPAKLITGTALLDLALLIRNPVGETLQILDPPFPHYSVNKALQLYQTL